MDLRLLEAEPTPAEREAIDAVVGAAEPNGNRVARSDRGSRHLLLPVPLNNFRFVLGIRGQRPETN